jgi:hypothetical protein
MGVVLRGRPPGLVERRVIVVARHVGLVAVAEVGPGEEAEIRPAVEHVQAEGLAVVEEPIEVPEEVLGLDPGPFLAPVGQPAGVELAAEDGDAALEPLGLVEVLFVRSRIEADGRSRQAARFEHVRGRAVGRVERHLDPGLVPEPLEGEQVVAVVAETAVLVLDLDHQDGPAAVDLEVADDLADLQDVGLAGGEVARIGAAHLDVGRPQQPSGQPAEIPLGAGVRPGPDDDPEPQALGRPDEGGQVVPAGEVPLARLGLEGVPEDIGRDRVQPGGFDLGQPVGPVLPGDALVMDLAGHDPEGAAVEEKVLLAEPEVIPLAGQPGGQDQDGQGGDGLSDASHASLPNIRVIHARRFYHRPSGESSPPGNLLFLPAL